MKVKLWCSVRHGATSIGVSGRLLVREVEMGALPDSGELNCIELYIDPDEGLGSGYMASVKRRYWDFDGTANLELIEIDVDPAGPLMEHYRNRRIDGSVYSMCWTTDVDPDPLPLMLASGWTEY